MDPADLINVVKQHPILWDISRPDYHDKHLKNASWTFIGMNFFKNWDNLSPSEKGMCLTEIKKKWVNIRDYYKKHIDMDSQYAKRRKYIYHDSLSFLRPLYERNLDLSPNILEKESSSSSMDELFKFDVKEEVIEEDLRSDQNDEVDSSADPDHIMTFNKVEEAITRTTKEPPLKLRAYKSNLIIDPLTTNALRMNDKEELSESDADLYFLKSLLPLIKSLTDTESVDLKIGILQLLKNIKSQSSVYPTNPNK